MKIVPKFSIVILFFVLTLSSFAQKGKALLLKNYNIQASGLMHELNKTRDTLVLRSKKKINYLYTANRKSEGKVKVKVDGNEYKLPLNQLKKGRNVMVAIQSPLKIVFVVKILKEFPKPFRSSLTAVVN